MHDWEIKRMVGQKVWNEYWPDRLYNHDGCDPDGMVLLGKTPHGEIVEMNKRVAESDLTIYVNLNFVPMNGDNKSMARFILDGGARVRELAPRWRTPTLLMWAGADRCVAATATSAQFRFSSGSNTRSRWRER